MWNEIMANEHSLSMGLEEFGLSKYESKAYVMLISKGTISAAELAYYSDIPRTKIYPTLLKLEKKKLVITSKSKPIMCTAVTPEDAFDSVVHEQINKVNAMNALVSRLKKASEESRKSRGSEEKRYFHLSANYVLEQLRTMIEGSKSSISMVADHWGLGLLAECRDQLASVIRRNLDVRLIVQPAHVCSEPFRRLPNGIKIRTSDTAQNAFIFDETELLVIDSENGKGAMFSSTDILAASQIRVFAGMWKGATKTDSLADMTKTEAQEIYKIVRTVSEHGFLYVMNSIRTKSRIDMLKLLEKNGINLKSKPLDELIDILDAVLQMTCSGHVSFEAGAKNIVMESKMNSGHSLPWASVLEGCLHRHGYKTRIIYQNHSAKGEKVHIKITKS